MLRFAKPVVGYFEEPAGTFELLLPTTTLVHVHTDAFPGQERATLRFFGEFGAVARPPRVELRPLAGDDALALAEALKIRLGLPRLPLVRPAEQLDEGCPHGAYVLAEGQLRHVSGRAQFGRVHLAGSYERTVREGRYRVLGFYYADRPSGKVPMPGVPGAWLDVIDMESAS